MERLIQAGEKERGDASVEMQEKGKRRSSLDERIEKIKEGDEGETSLALALKGAPESRAEKGGEPLLDDITVVARTTEHKGHKKQASAPVGMKNVRRQTDADMRTVMINIPEMCMVAAADVILTITVAHPTWPEEVILKLAREKRSIRELPDMVIRLLVHTTCMTRILDPNNSGEEHGGTI